MPEVHEQAAKQGAEAISLSIEEVCDLVREFRRKDVNAILHMTC